MRGEKFVASITSDTTQAIIVSKSLQQQRLKFFRPVADSAPVTVIAFLPNTE
jgi:hypothetical protein